MMVVVLALSIVMPGFIAIDHAVPLARRRPGGLHWGEDTAEAA
jgi:hypothetical protein